MPVHDEAATFETMVRTLGSVQMPLRWELIIVDDGSSDGAPDALTRSWVPGADRVRLVRGARNRGKGAALRHGFALAEGDIIGVQDADLEYDPAQIPELVSPIVDGRAEAVFGSRQFGTGLSYSFWYVIGNKGLSLAASVLFNRYITDAYTCYKFFTRECYERLPLSADGFAIEAELAGGLLAQGTRVLEIPIHYAARGREQGKKIRAWDGAQGLARLASLRVWGR